MNKKGISHAPGVLCLWLATGKVVVLVQKITAPYYRCSCSRIALVLGTATQAVWEIEGVLHCTGEQGRTIEAQSELIPIAGDDIDTTELVEENKQQDKELLLTE